MKSIKNNIINILARLIAALLLIWAIEKHPYDYYIMLRWIVCLVAAYTSYISAREDKEKWAWVFGIIALIFNPIIPVHLNREIWAVIDITAAIIIIVSIFFVRTTAINPDTLPETTPEHWQEEPLNVLIGDMDDNTLQLLTDAINKAIGKERNIQFLFECKVEGILRSFMNNAIDIIVLTINNISFQYENPPLENRIDRILRLILNVKRKYQVPVIVLGNSDEYKSKAELAGADYYITIPFSIEVFQNKIRELLLAERK